MARIRTIKPEFFTSERIAGLPLSARMTFVGLWTHVDDNGVTVDNARLITAAVWPLEPDPREALRRTHEDLVRLHEAGLLVRYEASGKRLLFVRGWDEHQKVSHPSKSRYPRPEAMPPKPPTSGIDYENTNNGRYSGEPPETLVSPPEILRSEQGTGNREQGTGKPPADARARVHAWPPDPANEDPPRTTAQTLVAEWIDHCARRPPGRVIGHTARLVAEMLAEGIDPDDIRRGLAAWMTKGLHPATLPSVVNEVINRPRPQPGNVIELRRPGPDIRPSTTDQRVGAGLALAQRLRDEEARSATQ